MLEFLKDIFNFADTWMIYRITVGLGTLFVGIAALIGVRQLIRVANLLEELLKRLQ